MAPGIPRGAARADRRRRLYRAGGRGRGRRKGLRVTVVEMAERILQRVACRETSDYFRDLHMRHGVEIREGVGLDPLTGEGRVTGARLPTAPRWRWIS